MKKLKLSISRLHYDSLRDLMLRYEDVETEIERLLEKERLLDNSKKSTIEKFLHRRKIRKAMGDLRICQRAIKDVWWIDSVVMFKDLKEEDEGE